MRIRLLAAGLTAVAIATLTACSSNPASPAARSSSSPTQPANSPSTASIGSSAPPAGSIPSPNAAQTAGLVAALKAVNPEIAVDQAKAVARARNVCQEIKAGKDDTTLAANAAARFSGGSVTITPEQGTAIVAGVKAAFCS
ncbi:DUF732 domain-containing protein [Kitasatospora sp. NPDC004614]|uniref:DUF732 domain-containing protein n=1 Tax=unclassified Kitasatospora TaxID=2633591 RepID=UPI00369286B3